MFDRKFGAPPAMAAGAKVGQQPGGFYPPGYNYANNAPASACVPQNLERRTLLGIDSTPSPQANVPANQTGNVVTSVIGTPAPFAFSVTPFCSVIMSRLLLPPEVADEIDITSVQIAGQEMLGNAGLVHGRSFVELGDNCCPLVQSTPATSSTPILIRGQTRGNVATLTLRASVLGDVIR